LPQALHLLDEALRRLQLEHVLEPLGDLVEPLDAEREAHAPLGPELVDQQRVRRALGPLEEQRRPAGLDRPVDDLRDLEVGIDLGGDADELALGLEQRDPLAKVLHAREPTSAMASSRDTSPAAAHAASKTARSTGSRAATRAW